MSKIMSDSELKAHCNSATALLNSELIKLADAGPGKLKKRAMLIAYWLHDYIKYFTKEDSFHPEGIYRLKRGSVVQVEFGYRVGRELGGRHYAVVLDRNNSIHSNTVTVVPLGSVKPHDEPGNRFRIPLEDGIYDFLSKKIDALVNEARETLQEAALMDIDIEAAERSEAIKLKTIRREKVEQARDLLVKAKGWLSEISHMKSGSVAMVDQITTISKMRITQPRKKTSLLYSIRLSPKDMDEIDAAIASLYFPKTEKC